MSDSPQIIAFYSFKGGVGRSMALLNLAFDLAAKRLNVLVLDMDLEAPGLSGFLHRENEISGFAQLDMVDLVSWASSAEVPLDPLAFPLLSAYAVNIPREKVKPDAHEFAEIGRLDIIPVEEGRDYYNRLMNLAMGNCDQDALVRMGSVLRAWLQGLRFPIDVPDYYGPNVEREAAYDFVLVDSRTGITETGGLCIGPLSDQLVIITALNDQNVEGTSKFLREVGILKAAPSSSVGSDSLVEDATPGPRLKPYMIVASLVPAGEIETKGKRLTALEKAVGKAVVKLSYHPQLALKETIFTRDYRDEYLAHEYSELRRQVLRMAGERDDSDPLLEVWSRPRSSPEFRDGVRRLLRVISEAMLGFFFNILLLTTVGKIDDEADFVLWDRICRILLDETTVNIGDVYITWGNLLSDWGAHSANSELAALRFAAAIDRYKHVLRSDREALALFNRGVVYGKLGDPSLEIADYTAVIEMPASPREQKAKALVNRGLAYGKQGDSSRAIADFTAMIKMPTTPTDQKAIAYSYIAWFHFLAGRYEEAIENGRQAIALDPENSTFHGNLAIAVLVLGRTDEALATYDRAIALADFENLDEMTKDLRDAMEKHGSIPGADEVLARIEARRRALEG